MGDVGSNFTLGDSFGNGSSDSVFVALHGRTSTDRAYVEGAIAYGRSNVSTARSVTIAGVDRLLGETNADSFAGNIEAGYHMGIFTPFAGLRAQTYTTNAFSETAESGSASYALRYDENTMTSVRSELGVDILWPAGPVGAGTPTFGLRAAWAHEFSSDELGTRSFLTVPDAVFSASGAKRDRDSIILAASVSMAANNGFHIEGAIHSEYSDNFSNLGGSVTVGYRW